MQPCNNTSVGILVVRYGALLLIERRRPPYGWTLPAGHVDPGEDYETAARRELREEAGLTATAMTLVHSGRYANRCQRPGGDWHRWAVYKATTEGNPARSLTETKAMTWADRPALGGLAQVTRQHLAAEADRGTWRQQPGLGPVFLPILGSLGWVGAQW